MKPSELIDYLYSKVGAHYYDRIDTRLQSRSNAKRCTSG